MSSPHVLLSVREAAVRLGIGRDTTYALVKSGRLRSIKVGRIYKVPTIELERFVARETES